MNAHSSQLLTRRHTLVLLGIVAASAVVTACTGSQPGIGPSPIPHPPDAVPTVRDFSGLFARFDAADEPNGDLAKVVWPAFVVNAKPEVKRLYEFQVVNGDLMKYMPCFCDCGRDDGHRNNRDCYIREVRPDGSVVFDSMAPT